MLPAYFQFSRLCYSRNHFTAVTPSSECNHEVTVTNVTALRLEGVNYRVISFY